MKYLVLSEDPEIEALILEKTLKLKYNSFQTSIEKQYHVNCLKLEDFEREHLDSCLGYDAIISPWRCHLALLRIVKGEFCSRPYLILKTRAEPIHCREFVNAKFFNGTSSFFETSADEVVQECVNTDYITVNEGEVRGSLPFKIAFTRFITYPYRS